MDKIYIASTLASANLYTNHTPGGADLPLPITVGGVQGVLIEGGAGVVGRQHIMTPEGAITEVTSEQLDYLLANPVFKLHQQNGFVKVLDSKPASAEAAAGDMNHADEGRQMTEGDLQAEADEDGNKVEISSAGKSTKSDKRK